MICQCGHNEKYHPLHTIKRDGKIERVYRPCAKVIGTTRLCNCNEFKMDEVAELRKLFPYRS